MKHKKKLFALLTAALLVFSMAGCGAQTSSSPSSSATTSSSTVSTVETLPEEEPAATGISAPEALALATGEQAPLAAALTPEGASGEPLQYASSDEAVATVDGAGTVTGVGAGECTIRTSAGDLVAETRVTVTVAVTGLRLSAASRSLRPGQSAAVSVYTNPIEAPAPESGALGCKSSNEAVATAAVTGDEQITITAIGEGSAEITVTYREFSTVCKVTVTTQPAQTAQSAQTGSGTAQGGSTGSSGSGSSGGSTPAPETPAPTPAPTPTPEPPAVDGDCPIDSAPLRADGSCPMESLHWMYQEPTYGYLFSDALVAAWQQVWLNDAGGSLNVIIPGGGMRDPSHSYTCDQCGGDIVIVARGPVLGCEDGCW